MLRIYSNKIQTTNCTALAILCKSHLTLLFRFSTTLSSLHLQRGGALCTIFGFYAAADPEIKKLSKEPVRVISVASPYVGNANFLMAFQSLERQRRLRHLRVANAEDLVSLMPVAAPKLGLNVTDLKKGIADLYRHCGIKLHLNDLSKRGNEPLYKFVYPQLESSDESIANELSLLFEDTKNFLNSIQKIVKKTEQVSCLFSYLETHFFNK